MSAEFDLAREASRNRMRRLRRARAAVNILAALALVGGAWFAARHPDALGAWIGRVVAGVDAQRGR